MICEIIFIIFLYINSSVKKKLLEKLNVLLINIVYIVLFLKY